MTMEIDNFPYLSEEQTMKFLNYNKTSMRVLRNSKALTRYEIGHRYFYDRKELIQLIESSQVKAQEKEEFDKYVQSLNKIVGLKDFENLEKRFILEKTHYLLTKIALSLKDIDTDYKFLNGRDWYVLLNVIKNKGNTTELCEKFNITSQRVHQVFERSLRLFISMVNKYKTSYSMIESIKEEIELLKKQNYELKAELFELNKHSQLLSENTDSTLYISVVDLDISVRLLNVLKVNDLKTIGDVLRFKRQDFLRFRNFGAKSLSELEDILEKFNLKLKR
jgi:hypothetical protein